MNKKEYSRHVGSVNATNLFTILYQIILKIMHLRIALVGQLLYLMQRAMLQIKYLYGHVTMSIYV